jgi:hypothetical protein
MGTLLRNLYDFGPFAKSKKKATISFVISVCLPVPSSVRTEELVSHWTGFHDV